VLLRSWPEKGERGEDSLDPIGTQARVTGKKTDGETSGGTPLKGPILGPTGNGKKGDVLEVRLKRMKSPRSPLAVEGVFGQRSGTPGGHSPNRKKVLPAPGHKAGEKKTWQKKKQPSSPGWYPVGEKNKGGGSMSEPYFLQPGYIPGYEELRFSKRSERSYGMDKGSVGTRKWSAISVQHWPPKTASRSQKKKKTANWERLIPRRNDRDEKSPLKKNRAFRAI